MKACSNRNQDLEWRFCCQSWPLALSRPQQACGLWAAIWLKMANPDLTLPKLDSPLANLDLHLPNLDSTLPNHDSPCPYHVLLPPNCASLIPNTIRTQMMVRERPFDIYWGEGGGEGWVWQKLLYICTIFTALYYTIV